MIIKREIVGNYIINTSVTPEEVLLEKERVETIIDFVIILKKKLSGKAFDILWLSAVEGWTHGEIAEKYGRERSTITKFLGKTQKKCTKLFPYGTIVQELFREPQSILEARSPESAGYPHEFLQDVNNGGEWKNCGRSGKRWVTKSICRLPEYFQESFNSSSVACPLCTDDWGVNYCTRLKEDQ